MADQTIPLTEVERKAAKAAYMREWYARPGNAEKARASVKRRRDHEPEKVAQEVRSSRAKERDRDPDAFRKKQAAKVARYRRENPEKRRQHKANRYRREKTLAAQGIITNERIGRNLAGRLRVAIKCSAKKGSAVRELGCSIEEFRRHIERQFLRGMTWQNWGRGKGKWHLDHIRPLASFDLSDPKQFQAAAHFTNYRPLWAKENIKKGAALTLLL